MTVSRWVFISVAVLAISIVIVRTMADKPRATTGVAPEAPGTYRAEVKRLYRDDVPYAGYIRAIRDQAESAWTQLTDSQRIACDINIYRPLAEALRFFNDMIPLPANESHRRYIAAMRISEAFASPELNLEKESRAFHREVFQSPEFQKSDSAYHDAVIDLWQRFEQTEIQVPYVGLVALNQPTIGRPGGQSHFMMDLVVADMYCQLRQYETAAQWYARIPEEGLGPLKAADAYFLGKQYADAERWYRFVLDNLDDWVAKQPELRTRALAMPLQEMDPETTKRHVIQRLSSIDQIRRSK